MSEFAECETLECWSLELLQRIDKSYFPQGEVCEFAHDDRVLAARASLLAHGIRQPDQLSPAECQTIFDMWVLVNESWTKVESGPKTLLKGCQVNFCKLEARLPEPEIRRQLQVDVNRSYAFLDIHKSLSPTQVAAHRDTLTQLLMRVLELDLPDSVSVSAPGAMELTPIEVRYLQGLHDVCCVVQALSERTVGGAQFEQVVSLCRCIIAHRIFPQHSSLSLLIAAHQTLSQVGQLLHRFHPRFLSSLVASRHEPIHNTDWTGDGSELHGILPWMITLFAHSIPKFSTLVAMWSVLFAFPPAFLTYWLAATLVAESSSQLMESGTPFLCDAEAMTELPSLFDLVVNATDYVASYTPLQLMQRTNDDLLLEQEIDLKWFDAADSYVSPLPPKSVLPPFWFPLLGQTVLAPRLDPSGLIRGLRSGTVQLYQARLKRLDFEWKLFREYSRQWRRRHSSKERATIWLGHLKDELFFVLIKPLNLAKMLLASPLAPRATTTTTDSQKETDD